MTGLIPSEVSRSVIRDQDKISIVRKDIKSANIPTAEAYSELMEAFYFFNSALFDDRLPDVIFTMVRRKNMLGYFRPDAFERSDGQTVHEICMNPSYMRVRPPASALSTLAHEMTHLDRHEFGPLNQRGGKGTGSYHDKVWADMMDRIGLTPTSTGMPKGNRTGNKMSHMIEPCGPFDIACMQLIVRGFTINWAAYNAPASTGTNGKKRPPSEPKKDRLKFTCSGCQLNAWAKPSARIRCGQCDITMMVSPENK